MLSKNKLKLQKGGNEDLLLAAQMNNFESVRNMLSLNDPNIDVNFREPKTTTTPLIEAIKNNNYFIVRDLLRSGANCNYVNRFKKTPLIYTTITLLELIDKRAENVITQIEYNDAKRSIYKIMKLLLKRGAKVNTIKYFKTPKKKSPFYSLCLKWDYGYFPYTDIKRFVHMLWKYDYTVLNTLPQKMQKRFKSAFPMNFQPENIAPSYHNTTGNQLVNNA